jgi:Holliday junction resolvase RusA-like endonuclease
MKYIVPIAPVPASRPKVTRWSTYYPKIYTQFKKDIALWVQTQEKTYLTGPISISITFYIKIPASLSKKNKKEREGTWCTKNYDTDNLQKALYDGINDYLIEDDRFIVHVKDVKKIWSTDPRIEFELNSI